MNWGELEHDDMWENILGFSGGITEHLDYIQGVLEWNPWNIQTLQWLVKPETETTEFSGIDWDYAYDVLWWQDWEIYRNLQKSHETYDDFIQMG